MARKAQALGLAFFLLGVAIAAWGQGKSLNRIVSEKLVGKIHRSLITESVKVSPDGKRVAYVAVVGNEQLVIVDGKEKQYDGILGAPTFSQDSQRVTYGAKKGNKWFAVVDGEDGPQYDAFFRERRIVFDRPDSFHYLVQKGSEIYLVEERIE